MTTGFTCMIIASKFPAEMKHWIVECRKITGLIIFYRGRFHQLWSPSLDLNGSYLQVTFVLMRMTFKFRWS